MNSIATIAQSFQELRRQMDQRVIGHADVKEALLLALLAQEHIYIEGPPGMAKTMLAEIIAGMSGLNLYVYQFHRDTRLNELVGDTIIERIPQQSGELIAQRIEKGRILLAELCVLDDITRAPGEALNVLLRILNERKYENDAIPLLTAVATGNPTQDDYYNEPLDPANLDRFTLQLKADGLLQSGEWDNAAQLLEQYSQPTAFDELSIQQVMDKQVLIDGYEYVRRAEIPQPVRQALLDILRAVIKDPQFDRDDALLTDRSFLVKSLKLLKARAVLEGRECVMLDDLVCLKYMIAFRIPQSVSFSDILGKHCN